MRAALIQMCSSDDPADNLSVAAAMIAEAAAQGADFVATPEVTNCVSASRSHQDTVLSYQGDDPVLKGLRAAAVQHKIWLSIGSLAIKRHEGARFANRSFLINPKGEIVAQYDKIHMFDVDVSATETFRESAGFRPGGKAVVAQTPLANFGLTICYDVRFGYLHRALAQAGAQVLLVPAAFSPVTGVAHWQVLLQARAIETGCFVIAAAQTGDHKISRGGPRLTYGHSMVISPWGEVLADAGTKPGVTLIDLDLSEVAKARGRIPALTHDRAFTGPD
ncbi:MAG: carbon-nitrogen hydrolase family protein [Rhodobacteraceae bacterium]|nr:carbon-nitrogen hydrolase family protein [Paracoccaceae bacterium]